MRNLGLKVYPSQANFVLLKFEGGERGAGGCADYLRRQGISVRRFAAPAYADCVRVSIGFEADMAKVEAAIAAFVDGGP